jgi:phytoene dehydrogenase-like protein
LCDRHFGGINYPVGGVGGIATSLADGLVDKGSEIRYKANVANVILKNGNAVSSLSDLIISRLILVLNLSCALLTTGWGEVIKWERVLC